MTTGRDIPFLQALGTLGSIDEISSGLRFTADKAQEQNPDIYLALETAERLQATAVYFKFYTDSRPAKPLIYIYDKSIVHNNISNADIHHILWNAGVVPVCYIFEDAQILVYNCNKHPVLDHSGESFVTSQTDTIKLLGKISAKIDQYKFKHFDSGLFWETNVGKTYKHADSAYEQLLKQLSNVKSRLIKEAGEEHATLVKKILMMLILIKYLEERVDDEGNSALNPYEFYKSYCPDSPTLSSVLENAALFIRMLDDLSSKNHFNGHVFYLSEHEKHTLTNQIDLSLFQYFVEGNVEFTASGRDGIGQGTLWRLYQFNYLPIELISHIYEDFLVDIRGDKKKGVVYTPPSLVQLLLDQTMPLSDPKEDFKVLDPACGSGIFLVGAYKRMIQWWRLQNNWARPAKENIEELKGLLKNNIYGCDIEDEAVTLTYFSLSLALLDALSPKEIWENVHFDDLRETNLFSDDFFQTLTDNKLPVDFQLIIGNPPFKSELTNIAAEVNKNEKENYTNRPNLPDNQIALLFLEQSMKLLAQEGNCCMIMPAGPLLYNQSSHPFKKYLLGQFHAKYIYDFIALRTKLFNGSGAKPAVVSVVLEKNGDFNQPTTHFILRRTNASGEKIEFEIDYYDIHHLPYDLVLNNPQIWQINFFGGGRLRPLMNEISNMRTLGEYVDEQHKNRSWKIAEGWIESGGNKNIQRIQELSAILNRDEAEDEELKKLEEKFKADWITNHKFVKTEHFTEAGISETEVCNSQYFLRRRAKNKKIFQPPHLLIKEQAGEDSIPIELREDYLTFKNEIIGIHAPWSDIELLRDIELRFKDNKYYSALLWLLSGRIITAREGVVLKTDIMTLPYPETPITWNKIEQILLEDVINNYSEFRVKGEESKLLQNVNTNELYAYGKIYCDILNSIYDDFQPIEPIIGEKFITCPFVLGEKPESEIPLTIADIEKELIKLTAYKGGYNLWIKRVIRVYHQNIIFIYKPIQRRYWLPSIAVRDADATFLDLFKQGK